jgi:succinyl-CoA synthetase beta subunit
MGVINAAQAIGMKKPIIVRLKGTNVEEAKKLIEASVRLYQLKKKKKIIIITI